MARSIGGGHRSPGEWCWGCPSSKWLTCDAPGDVSSGQLTGDETLPSYIGIILSYEIRIPSSANQDFMDCHWWVLLPWLTCCVMTRCCDVMEVAYLISFLQLPPHVWTC